MRIQTVASGLPYADKQVFEIVRRPSAFKN